MEHIQQIPVNDENARLDLLKAQNERCIAARCRQIGRSGCILETILPLPAKLRLAEPCANAVSMQPIRQLKDVA